MFYFLVYRGSNVSKQTGTVFLKIICRYVSTMGLFRYYYKKSSKIPLVVDAWRIQTLLPVFEGTNASFCVYNSYKNVYDHIILFVVSIIYA